MFSIPVNIRIASSATASCSTARQPEPYCHVRYQQYQSLVLAVGTLVLVEAYRLPMCFCCRNVPRYTNASVLPRAESSKGTSRCQALVTDVTPSSDRGQQQADQTRAYVQIKTPQADKYGVLLLNLGGPECLDDVQPFLYNLFADPDIIRLPASLRGLQPLLATIIATLRAPKSAEGYKAIGGGSPLRRITDQQASALAKSLKAKGLDVDVYVAMRYWHPYTEEALQHIVRDGVTKLVILPLYPQFSISTSGSSLRLLEQIFKRDAVLRNLKHTVIPSWYQRPGYVGAMADLIETELAKLPNPPQVCSWGKACVHSSVIREVDMPCFSAHGAREAKHVVL